MGNLRKMWLSVTLSKYDFWLINWIKQHWIILWSAPESSGGSAGDRATDIMRTFKPWLERKNKIYIYIFKKESNRRSVCVFEETYFGSRFTFYVLYHQNVFFFLTLPHLSVIHESSAPHWISQLRGVRFSWMILNVRFVFLHWMMVDVRMFI